MFFVIPMSMQTITEFVESSVCAEMVLVGLVLCVFVP